MLTDPHDRIESALRRALVGIPDVAAVTGWAPEPLAEHSLPAIVVDCGTETVTRIGADQGGPGHVRRALQVDVLVVAKLQSSDARGEARRLRSAVVARLADHKAFVDAEDQPLDLDDFRLVSISTQQIATEDGEASGFHLAYSAVFVSPESDFSVIV